MVAFTEQGTAAPCSASAHFGEAEIVREERRAAWESLCDEWERDDDRRYYEAMT